MKMKKTQKKTYSYYRIMREVLHNPKVISWGDLYTELGVFDWFADRDVKPDVRNIFMSLHFQQYISEILNDKFVTSKTRSKFGTHEWLRRKANWDSFNYSPTSLKQGDYLLLDLKNDHKNNRPEIYDRHMPHFNKD